jgi:hypothetical protein
MQLFIQTKIRYLGIFTVVMFLSAGNLGVVIPIFADWRLEFAIVSACCAFPSLFILKREAIPVFGLIAAALLLAAFAESAPNLNDYISNKPTNVVLSLLFCTLMPLLLLRKSQHTQFFLNLLCCYSLIIAIAALPRLSTLMVEAGRLSLSEESNPIYVARAVGIPILWLMLLYLWKRISLWPLLLGGGLCLVVLLATGSRGPILTVILTLVIVVFRAVPFRDRRTNFVLWASVVSLFVVSIAYNTISTAITKQIFERGGDFLSGRQILYEVAIDAITQYPAGIGLGGFSTLASIPGARYPHNLLMEITVELGWLAGLFSVGVLVYIWQFYEKVFRTNIEIAGVYALFLYSLLNSMFSGDLSSAKEVYITISLGLIGLATMKNFTKDRSQGSQRELRQCARVAPLWARPSPRSSTSYRQAARRSRAVFKCPSTESARR